MPYVHLFIAQIQLGAFEIFKGGGGKYGTNSYDNKP
jgi:PHP family Zn ribbon phosphoesterase